MVYKVDGDINKSVKLIVYLLKAKHFKCLISPSILDIDRKGRSHFQFHKDVESLSFINYRKSKTIFMSCLKFPCLLGHQISSVSNETIYFEIENCHFVNLFYTKENDKNKTKSRIFKFIKFSLKKTTCHLTFYFSIKVYV